MSTWGGIGEGLTAGMNARIALEEQRRKDAQAQANADRQFKFQQEQADRAQANADRTFDASRSDADRTFAESVRRTNMTQANADRKYGLKQDELALKSDIAIAENDRAEEELALKQQAQDWANRTNEERLRSFRLANDKLDREERQAQMVEDAKMSSGRQQLAMALYRVTGQGGQEQTITVNENGNQVQKKVRVLPQSAREQIFGKDGYFKDVQNVVAFEDEKGNTVAALVKPDGTMQMFSPDQQYDVYGSAFGKGFAEEQMRSVSEKRSLGLFAQQKEIEASAAEKARLASDPYGKKRMIDAATAILRDQNSSDEDRQKATQFLLSQIDGGASGVSNKGEWVGFSPEKRAYLEQNGYVWDAATGRPKKAGKKRIKTFGVYAEE